MTSVRPVGEYRDRLYHLLERSDANLDAEERVALRAVIRERRFGRSRRLQDSASAAVNARASEIVDVLERAARELRPRETQSLDDFVAGREPQPAVTAEYSPVRLRRRNL